MNRYTFYNHSSNAYYLPSSGLDTRSYHRAQPVSLSKTSTSGNLIAKMSNKYSTPSYKSSELPWTASLASTGRYPLTKSSTTYSIGESKNPVESKSGRYAAPINTYQPITSTSSTSSALSRTVSGRSIFDYHRPTQPTNSTKSAHYDGIPRRTLTERHPRDYNQPITIASHTSLTKSDHSSCKLNQSPIVSTATKHVPTSTPSINHENRLPTSTVAAAAAAAKADMSKPHRTTSLRVKSSYSSIIDQLASSTFAKLRLTSTSSSAASSRNSAQAPDNALINNASGQIPALKEELVDKNCAQDDNLEDACAIVKGKSSPGSTTSGLSSLGPPSTASPTIYSTPGSVSHNNCSSLAGLTKLDSNNSIRRVASTTNSDSSRSNISTSQDSGKTKSEEDEHSGKGSLGNQFMIKNGNSNRSPKGYQAKSLVSDMKPYQKQTSDFLGDNDDQDDDSQYIDSSDSNTSLNDEKELSEEVNQCELVIKSKTCPSLGQNAQMFGVSSKGSSHAEDLNNKYGKSYYDIDSWNAFVNENNVYDDNEEYYEGASTMRGSRRRNYDEHLDSFNDTTQDYKWKKRRRRSSSTDTKILDDADGHLIFRPGDILKRRFKVEQIIGQGTFAQVAHVVDITMNDTSGRDHSHRPLKPNPPKEQGKRSDDYIDRGDDVDDDDRKGRSSKGREIKAKVKNPDACHNHRRKSVSPSIESSINSSNLANTSNQATKNASKDQAQDKSYQSSSTRSNSGNSLNSQATKTALPHRPYYLALKIIKNVGKYREAARYEINVLNHLQESRNYSQIRATESNSMSRYSNDSRLITELNEITSAGRRLCVQMLDWFDYHGHICILFEMLGRSVFDFMKMNHYQPYPMVHVRAITHQLTLAVNFLHKNKITHTDLKPENILLVNDAYTIEYPDRSRARQYIVVKDPSIRLIDFGSATFEHEHHSKVVSTRHYRAIEVILELGWSHPCDVWSIGCIAFELYTGITMFQTHDNREHLAMMEYILGRIPSQMGARSRTKYFTKQGHLIVSRFSPSSYHIQKTCRPLMNHMISKSQDELDLFDLIYQMLTYDPLNRINCMKALKHPFLASLTSRLLRSH